MEPFLAERAVDLAMLGIVVVIMLALQFDKIDLFQSKIDSFNAPGQGCGNTMIFTILGKVVTYGILAGIAGGVLLFIFKPNFRDKIKSFVKGVFEGIFSIFKTKNKLKYIGTYYFHLGDVHFDVFRLLLCFRFNIRIGY